MSLLSVAMNIRGSLRSVLDIATSAVMIVAASTLIYKNLWDGPRTAQAEPELPNEPLSIDGANIRGSDAANVVMVMFSDFQCPFCRRFAREVLPEIERRYVQTGRVALAFRHFPLPIHKQARPAAVMAECAGHEGLFGQMHDLLFDQEDLDAETLLAIRKSLHLDGQSFEMCLLDQAVAAAVATSVDQAHALRVRATPTFFLGRRDVNGRVTVSRAISGAKPVSDFVEQLDDVLAGKQGTRFSWRALLRLNWWNQS
jgi:protein-disulfide isomerase